MREETKAGMNQCSTGGKLLIAFHGEIVFFDDCDQKSEIVAITPDIDVHVYSAGPWLGEQKIPRGVRLHLDGVAQGTATFEDQQDLTIMLYNASLDVNKPPKEAYTLIQLPRPEAIYSGHRETLGHTSVIVSPPSDLTIPSDGAVALCTVLEYRLNDAAPYLNVTGLLPGDNCDDGMDDGGGDDLPAVRQFDAGNPINGHYIMHVYAEADRFLQRDHVFMASEMSAQLVGKHLTMKASDSISRTQLLFASSNCISAPDEFHLSLAQRSIFLRSIGEQLHQGNDTCLKWQVGGATSLSPRTRTPGPVGTQQCGNLVSISKAPKPKSEA